MAWQCSGRTNEELIHNLFREKLITSERVRDAMIKVDRAHYAPTNSTSNPYEDSPQVIGYGATISAPHMHTHAAESLLPFLKPGAKVLDIGSGSGYLTHVFAELVIFQNAYGGREGVAVGLEHIEALRELGEGNMRKSESGRKFLEGGKVRFVRGDGRRGWVDEGDDRGWDAIHVGAAAVEVHAVLVEQLRSPGRIFIPVSDRKGDQHIWVIDKDAEGKVERKKLFGVRYVPLTDAPED